MRWLMILLLAAQQDVKLQPKVSVGQRTEVSVESTLDLEILVKDGEWEPPPPSPGGAREDDRPRAVKDDEWKSCRLLSAVRKEKFAQEVTQVADGMPVTMTLRCLSSTLQKSGTNITLGTEATPLEGKTFLGTRSEQGWGVKDQEGNPPPFGGHSLGAWNEYARLLPAGAVRADDSWKVDARGLGHLLFTFGTSDVAGTLECAVESLAGGRATILFKGSVEGRGKDESVLALTFSGSRLVFDVVGGKPLSLTINGSLESRRDVVESIRKPGSLGDEKRKVGEILARSRKLEVSFVFE